MARLGENRYGKAQIRLMKVDRDTERHVLHDLNVSISLSGDMEEVHLSGDNATVLPTDTQKNTAYAFAREHGVGEIEDFAALLARHFVDSPPSIHRARVHIEEYAWERLDGAAHSFAQSGRDVRTATVTYDGERERTLSGITGLVLLSSTGSEFTGFVKDRWTTLADPEGNRFDAFMNGEVDLQALNTVNKITEYVLYLGAMDPNDQAAGRASPAGEQEPIGIL